MSSWQTALIPVLTAFGVGAGAMWAVRLAGVATRWLALQGLRVVGISGRDEASREVRRSVTAGLVPGTRARCRRCWWRAGVQADHVIPAAWGGPGAAWNMRPLCGRCNQRRGASITVPEVVWLIVPGPRDWPAYAIAAAWLTYRGWW